MLPVKAASAVDVIANEAAPSTVANPKTGSFNFFEFMI
jgi:hypothetical protein